MDQDPRRDAATLTDRTTDLVADSTLDVDAGTEEPADTGGQSDARRDQRGGDERLWDQTADFGVSAEASREPLLTAAVGDRAPAPARRAPERGDPPRLAGHDFSARGTSRPFVRGSRAWSRSSGATAAWSGRTCPSRPSAPRSRTSAAPMTRSSGHAARASDVSSSTTPRCAGSALDLRVSCLRWPVCRVRSPRLPLRDGVRG
jgi:hypothetical protein